VTHVGTADEPTEIWFLTGSQSLYGEEVLAQVAEPRWPASSWP
jgi:L-arabinose isomerase